MHNKLSIYASVAQSEFYLRKKHRKETPEVARAAAL